MRRVFNLKEHGNCINCCISDKIQTALALQLFLCDREVILLIIPLIGEIDGLVGDFIVTVQCGFRDVIQVQQNAFGFAWAEGDLPKHYLLVPKGRPLWTEAGDSPVARGKRLVVCSLQ
jgi:hypothetical protein